MCDSDHTQLNPDVWLYVTDPVASMCSHVYVWNHHDVLVNQLSRTCPTD